MHQRIGMYMIILSFLDPRVHPKKYRKGDSEKSGSLKFILCPVYVQEMSV